MPPKLTLNDQTKSFVVRFTDERHMELFGSSPKQYDKDRAKAHHDLANLVWKKMGGGLYDEKLCLTNYSFEPSYNQLWFKIVGSGKELEEERLFIKKTIEEFLKEQTYLFSRVLTNPYFTSPRFWEFSEGGYRFVSKLSWDNPNMPDRQWPPESRSHQEPWPFSIPNEVA